MPLTAPVAQLGKTNCVRLMLDAFHPNAVVKALIFLPGATDEFYFFDRATARLTNVPPSLLDAVTALTNQTRIRATFRAPFLLLHTAEESPAPWFRVSDATAAAKLKERRFLPRARFNDRNWDYLQPVLTKTLAVKILPAVDSPESWHFYRASFAADALNAWEALEAISLASRTWFEVRHDVIAFERVSREQMLERHGH